MTENLHSHLLYYFFIHTVLFWKYQDFHMTSEVCHYSYVTGETVQLKSSVKSNHVLLVHLTVFYSAV